MFGLLKSEKRKKAFVVHVFFILDSPILSQKVESGLVPELL